MKYVEKLKNFMMNESLENEKINGLNNDKESLWSQCNHILEDEVERLKNLQKAIPYQEYIIGKPKVGAFANSPIVVDGNIAKFEYSLNVSYFKTRSGSGLSEEFKDAIIGFEAALKIANETLDSLSEDYTIETEKISTKHIEKDTNRGTVYHEFYICFVTPLAAMISSYRNINRGKMATKNFNL